MSLLATLRLKMERRRLVARQERLLSTVDALVVEQAKRKLTGAG